MPAVTAILVGYQIFRQVINSIAKTVDSGHKYGKGFEKLTQLFWEQPPNPHPGAGLTTTALTLGSMLEW